MREKLILQVNVPICQHRCAYCSCPFTPYSPGLAAAYAKALVREAESAARDMDGYEVCAISIEGGSPALLDAALLQELIRVTRRSFHLAKDVQICLETMPGDYSRALMEKMRDCGVNHWIIGLESADLAEHALLERPYRFDALTMVDTAIRVFRPRDLSFHLLYGIPGQSEKSLDHTLNSVLSYRPEHLTLRPLQLEAGTRLQLDCLMGSQKALPEEETQQLRLQAKKRLEELGYRAYTRWDYCFPGHENRFRTGQMEGTAQLGLGYRAVSILDGFTWKNGHSMQEYLDHSEDYTILADQVCELTGEALEIWERTRGNMRPV